MKPKTDSLYPALFAFLCSILVLSSCSYDASPFHRLEGPTCPGKQTLCGDVCVTLGTKEHCVKCGDLCSFDRICKKDENNANYQCKCPEGTVDCGNDLSCSWLDGGTKSSSDKRCGSCNTFCANSEICMEKKCVCTINNKPLSGQELAEEFLKNDANCGGCGKECLDGMHCVLGQCTKTECGDTECHFPLPDGREECQLCQQKCRLIGPETPEIKPTQLTPIIAYTSDNPQLNASNTSLLAYGEPGGTGFTFKRATGCKCGENTCVSGKADRCDAGLCVCSVGNNVCSPDTTCTTQGCQTPCDERQRACAGKASCIQAEKLCQCSGAQPQEAGPDAEIAHCIDGLVCGAGGKCYCPTFEGQDLECGVRGDRCLKGKCVCGALDKGCERNTICKDAKCYCGTVEGCDAELSPNCVNDKCVCGTDKSDLPCDENQKCLSDACVCVKDKACESKDGKLSQANKCDRGKCVCGDTGDPCTGTKVCDNGKCLCTQNTDCSENETCDTQSGQCFCGNTGAPCPGSSVCVGGQCLCTQNADCPGDESCDKKSGLCICGKTGGSCPGSRVCRSGKCLCTQNTDCSENESCDTQSGQCTCGGANLCRSGSTCTKAGLCRCGRDGDCNDEEVCKDMGGFGNVCVCGTNDKQKSCKLGVKCQWISDWVGYKCLTNDVNKCYPGERIIERDHKKHCVCGDEWKACGPGRTCKNSKCEWGQ